MFFNWSMQRVNQGLRVISTSEKCSIDSGLLVIQICFNKRLSVGKSPDVFFYIFIKSLSLHVLFCELFSINRMNQKIKTNKLGQIMARIRQSKGLYSYILKKVEFPVLIFTEEQKRLKIKIFYWKMCTGESSSQQFVVEKCQQNLVCQKEVIAGLFVFIVFINDQDLT